MNTRLCFVLSLIIVLLVSVSCTSVAGESAGGIPGIEIPESDMELMNELFREIDQIDLNFFPGKYAETGKLEKRWEIDGCPTYVNAVYGDHIIPQKEGWIFSTWDDIDNYNAGESEHLSFITNPENGERYGDDITKYFGLVCSSQSEIDCLNFNKKLIESINDKYYLIHLKRTYLVDKKTKEIKASFSPGDNMIVSPKNYLYSYYFAVARRLNLDFPDENGEMPGFYDNIFMIDSNIWLHYGNGALGLLDEDLNLVTKREYTNSMVDLEIPHDLNNILTIQLFKKGVYEDFILGRVVNYDELREKYGINVLYSCDFERSLSNMYPIENDFDIQEFVLINPNTPDVSYRLDDEILGDPNTAAIKLTNGHFIVENDDVLKCIDPFKGEDIWWISRDDVGEKAKPGQR
ncbi:MAG: hypothetical protein R2883_00605 [Caldisericia bacterium]